MPHNLPTATCPRQRPTSVVDQPHVNQTGIDGVEVRFAGANLRPARRTPLQPVPHDAPDMRRERGITRETGQRRPPEPRPAPE